jgi:hypothetical protein
MRLVFSAAAGMFAVLVAILLSYGGANAAPLPKLAMEHDGGLLHQVRSGCGWDYACPPRPNYRRKTIQNNYVRGNQFTIENYGRVHIYYNEHEGHPHKPHHHRPHARRHPHEHRRHHGQRYRHGSDHECRNGSCEGRCGPGCWYQKFKSGHCGHGCNFYRERVRFEEETREVRVRRPVFDNRFEDDGHEFGRFQERRRFDRPGYPQCDGEDC